MANAGDGTNAGPLHGIKVVELGIWIAGPATAALGDWGADVVKIEHPVGGEPLRGLKALGFPTEPTLNPASSLTTVTSAASPSMYRSRKVTSSCAAWSGRLMSL